MYRRCNQPITSFGCIAYRIAYDKTKNAMRPEFLLVQRKDSLAYVELLRGKYVLQNVKYIQQLLCTMTRHELDRLRTKSFSDLWSELWMYGASKCYLKEYSDSESKLNRLKEGYELRDGRGEIQSICLERLVSDVETCLPETEWGFPKGRRNLLESDKNCALREFKEETGIKPNRIRIRHDKPIDEVFTGTNHVRYRHVYYIAEYVVCNAAASNDDDVSANAPAWQASEIKDVQWFSFSDAMCKLAEANVERRELLKRVNSIVQGAHFNHAPPCRAIRKMA
jgi:8-oxo-dGTP pyrophosphatase MutT (NUDIX family)